MACIKIFSDNATTLEDKYSDFDLSTLIKVLRLPKISPRYRVFVVNPDESISYTIPNTDINLNGIQFTENYQQGERRSCSLSLNNSNGNYTPGVNGIWVDTKIKIDIGISIGDSKIVWFPKGIFIISSIELTESQQEKTVQLTLVDKFAMFSRKTGTLEESYEIPVNSTIIDVIDGILNTDLGNGEILDYKPAIYDSSFIGMKTQVTIRKEAGDNLASIIEELATQMSAEYYYNNNGNLMFIPIDETVGDEQKPIIWSYRREEVERDVNSISMQYNNEEVINVVKVIGDNTDGNLYYAVEENNNPASPICVERIGRRIEPPYNESSVYSNENAGELARYYLRQKSFFGVQFNIDVSFNPILAVNNIIELENSFLDLKMEKLLISSLSWTSGAGNMTLTVSNVSDLPNFMKKNFSKSINSGGSSNSGEVVAVPVKSPKVSKKTRKKVVK